MKNNILTLRFILLLIFCSFCLIGCDDDNQDLVKYIQDTKARPPRPIEGLPTFTPVAPFQYPENSNRRDPFKNPQIASTNNVFEPDKNRKKDPLEAYPLDALNFVGTFKEGSQIWALIAIPDGRIMKIRSGEYMGQNFGKVLSIKQDRINIEETIKTQDKWEKKLITLNLNTKGTAKP